MSNETFIKISNSITSDVNELIDELQPKDIESFLSGISSILCELNPDIAITVMNNFGKDGAYQATCIKIKYGY
jgi:hypothetical protein